MALCPVHEGRESRPSLSIWVNDEDGIGLACKSAGLGQKAILHALGLHWSDLVAPSTESGTREDVYDYTSPNGDVLYQVERTHHPDRARIRFKQRRPPDTDGKCVYEVPGELHTLYRLPRVLAAVRDGRSVFVVEGEKDVHTLERLGHVATTSPMGAGEWQDKFADSLCGAVVTVIADKDTAKNDYAGQRHALDVATSLERVGANVTLRQAAFGKDVTDHVAAGGSADQLVPFEPPPEKTASEVPAPRVAAVPHLSGRLLTRDQLGTGPARAWLVKDYLFRDSLACVWGEPGSGKSFYALERRGVRGGRRPMAGTPRVGRSGRVCGGRGSGGPTRPPAGLGNGEQ